MFSYRNKIVSIMMVMTFLTICFFGSAIPGGRVNAEPAYKSAVTFVMYEKNQVAVIDIDDLAPLDVLDTTNVSSSNSSVASIYSITRNDQECETELLDTTEASDDANTCSYSIGLKMKKAGSTNISFSVGGITYVTAVTVVKYVNPVKTIKIKGINKSKNIASKTKKKNYVNFKGITKKSSTISVTPKSGWTVERISCTCSNTDESVSRKNTVKNLDGSNGSVKVSSLSIGNLYRGYTYFVDITLLHKNGHREELHYCISNTEKLQSVY